MNQSPNNEQFLGLIDKQAQISQQFLHELKNVGVTQFEQTLNAFKQVQAINQKLKKHQQEQQEVNLVLQQNNQYLNQILESSDQYSYELQLEREMELPCYRNRIFNIEFILTKEGNLVENQNNISLELGLYTHDKSQKRIQHNNKGQNIFKGRFQAVLKKGKVKFEKIQIREVSSHFVKNKFYFAVIPIDSGNIQGNAGEKIIDHKWIKPFVIKDFVVKAKKFHERHVPYFADINGELKSEIAYNKSEENKSIT